LSFGTHFCSKQTLQLAATSRDLQLLRDFNNDHWNAQKAKMAENAM
jgi:hypothetical protein